MENDVKECKAISLLKQGDIYGLKYLVGKYQHQAVRTSYLITLDRHQAEDITQEVFLRLVKTIHQYDESRPFAPWFLKSIINQTLKAINREKRSVRYEPDSTSKVLTYLEEFTDSNPEPEEVIVDEETKNEVISALKQLPPSQRVVIIQRYYLDLSEPAIGVKLERPLGTIKWQIHSALQKLRALLEPSIRPKLKSDGIAVDSKKQR